VSDVANFLACQHLTRLDLLRARGELQPPRQFDIGFQTLVARGAEHERSVLQRFAADGREVVKIEGGQGVVAAVATLEAIRRGAEIIYQGVLTSALPTDSPALLGLPDFLIRADLLPAPDGQPRPDGAHYEVVDAKLARSAKGRAVAQTAFYSHLLGAAQGVAPRWMHLALGRSVQAKPFH
jgi:predicted RecB family nuclease